MVGFEQQQGMTKDTENGPEGCGPGSAGEEQQAPLPQIRDQSNKGSVKGCGINTIIKEGKLPISFYIYILLLFAGCFILFPQFEGIRATLARTPKEQAQNFTTQATLARTPKEQAQNFTTAKVTNPNITKIPLIICSSAHLTPAQTCRANPPPLMLGNEGDHDHDDPVSSKKIETCPDYFRWIHEDLKPWKAKGITREAVEAGKGVASFRLVVLQGRIYVETYHRSFQTRDVFTIWGIVQLIRVYPGKIPDLDLLFECGDYPVVQKAHYAAGAGGSAPMIPPVFHYCGDDRSFDIPFPDWSFWGWHEINIKPWESLVRDLKEGNRRVKWVDRMPYAFWKGNIRMGRRASLLRCNSIQDWRTQIFAQRWGVEVRRGFRQSNLADQCTHRYKIYMEGRAWSVSEKYIQACDSMLLLALPRYYEFFTRSLVPLKHYWPISPWKLCNSIKFAVDWGNNNTYKAQEIGKEGSKFILEELKMKNIYDYMFHLLSEYGRLLKYKPTVPPNAIEVCLESMVCNSFGKEKQWKIDSMAKGPSQTGPCVMPPPYDPHQLQKFLSLKEDIIRKVDKWVARK